MTNIVLKTYDYVEEILNSEMYIKYVDLNLEIEEKYKKEIKIFNVEKKKYYDVIEYGKFHPDYQKVLISFSKAKNDLYSKKLVKEMFFIEKMIEKEINNFIKDLTKKISKHIPIPNEIGIINKGGTCSVG